MIVSLCRSRGNFAHSMLPQCYIVVNYILFMGIYLLQCYTYRVVNHCKIAIDFVSIRRDDGLRFKIYFNYLIWSVVQNGSEL